MKCTQEHPSWTPCRGVVPPSLQLTTGWEINQPRTQAHPSFSMLHAEKREGLGVEVTCVTLPQTGYIYRLPKVILINFKQFTNSTQRMLTFSSAYLQKTKMHSKKMSGNRLPGPPTFQCATLKSWDGPGYEANINGPMASKNQIGFSPDDRNISEPYL